MKRMIALLMALAMCLVLCACGSSAATQETEEPEVTEATEPPMLQIGEAATTDKAELVIQSVEFADYVRGSSDDLFLPVSAAESSNGDYVPKDGNVFVCVSFSVENTGKQTLRSTSYFQLSVDYNDGYTYEFTRDHCVRTDDSFYAWRGYTGVIDLEPLSDPQTYRCYVEVPVEIRDNTEAPLLIRVVLASTAGDINEGAYFPDKGDVEFLYKIR